MSNSLFNHFTSSQPGFLLGDSCIPQLLPIKDEIQTTFDNNPTVDVRGVFLDISKAFDKVWHSGLLFKVQTYGVEVTLLALLKDYLDKCEQKVALKVHSQV